MSSRLPTLHSQTNRHCLRRRIHVLLPHSFCFDGLASQKEWNHFGARFLSYKTVQRYTVSSGDAIRIESDEASDVSASQSAADRWNPRMDPYLPLELRSRTWLENLAGFEGVRSVETLPSILEETIHDFPQTIFAHLGLNQGRWDALAWLSKAVISYRCPQVLDPTSFIQDKSIWREAQDFDLARSQSIKLNQHRGHPFPEHERLQNLTETGATLAHKSASSWKLALGQVWQCLGHVVIKASNLEIQERSRMMAFIHQLIAHIHSEGAISPSIYQFESSDVSAPLRKPPFLHLMSSRIMTALSDAVWKVTEPKLMGDAALVAATYAYKGYEMPGSELNPRVRLLGPEVWLEFILWSCVHGSYFIEAGKLIEHVQRQRGNQEWKTKSWEHIQESLDQKWATVKDPDRVRSWFDRIAGTAEGYSEDPPAASLGERTLSREVVAAIANGLITDNSSGASRHEHLANMWPCLKSCRALAGPPSNPVESLFWNAISNRLFEASHVAGSTSNEVLSRMSSLAEGSEEALDLMNNQEHTSLALEVVESRSPALHPILLHALEQCVRDRDVSNGMVCFGKLKTWADRNLHVLIDNEPPVPQQGTVAFASLTAYLPTHALASLFDFMTEAKLFTFGRMLLPLLDPPRESGIVHGPYLSNSSVLQNSVLRFANATDDRDLEIAVLTRADWKAGQASDDAIRELLHVQLAAGRWDYVESLLIHMQAERKIVLTSVDIARIVSLYLQRPEESLTSIVRSLFLRHYLPPRDYSKSPDYTSFRTLNQMALILLTIREIRPSLLKDCIIRQGQASNPIIIPTDAFNILLWKVVSLYGIQEARNFFKRWCILTPASQSSNNKPTPIIPRNSELDASGAKVIVPNIQTLRIMISPSLKALQSTIPGLDPALVEPGAPNQSVSPAKAYRLTYDAFRKLPQGSRLKANIDWAIHTALRLGLVGHEKYEVLLRQVGRDEVVRGTRRRVAGMGEDAAMEEDEDGLEGEEGLEKGEEGREGVRRKGRWC